MAYFVSQEQFFYILSGFAIAFASYILLVFKAIDKKRSYLPFFILAIVVRVSLLYAFPALSDDIYRFIWDGEMIHSGIHPLSYTPEYIVSNLITDNEYLLLLYDSMNSGTYYTVYPPVHQLCFYLSSIGDQSSLQSSAMILRIIILCAEFATFVFLLKILDKLGKPRNYALVYVLNPLIIIELTANLHFEAIMICFLMGFIYFLIVNRVVLASFFFALSVATKLLPLMFIPAIMWYLYNRGGMKKFLLSTVFFSGLLFIPLFWSLDLMNFLTSIDLYFQKFEFNASIYYLMRELGMYLTGYNQIAVIGPVLAMTTLLLILWYTRKRKPVSMIDLVDVFIFSFGIYLLLGTTIHPWYLSILIALSVIRMNYWVVLWSFLVILSYGVYWFEGIPYALIFLEYFLLGMVLLIEKKYPLQIS